MKYIYSVLLGVIVFSLNAQPTFNNTYKNDTFSTYPLGAYCSFSGVITTDTAFYLIGSGLDSSHTLPYPNYWYNTGWFLRTDVNGQIQKNRLFVDDNNPIHFRFYCIASTSDGNLALVGRNNADAILLKTNTLGDTIWTKRYISNDSLIYFEPLRIVESKDKGFYLLLRTLNYNTNAPYSLRGTIIKTDSLGNEQWRYMYNPLTHRTTSQVNIIEVGNYLFLFGAKVRGSWLVDWNLEEQTYIRKIDSTGALYGEYLSDINEYISIWDGIQTQDGGFVFCGIKQTQISVGGGPDYIHQAYIAKVDSNLQLLWEKDFGKPDRNMALQDVDELPDGSLIAAGRRVIFYPEATATYTNYDSLYGGGWLIKFSANGDSLWQRIHRQGAGIFYVSRDVEVMPDGGFVAAGYAYNSTIASPTSGDWGWLIRTDSFGCIVPGCQLLDNTENMAVVFDNEVVVFPNPASEVVRFRFEKAVEKDAVIRVYSGLGQLVGQVSVDNVDVGEIDVSDFNSGVYFYGVYVEGVLVKQGQVLVQR